MGSVFVESQPETKAHTGAGELDNGLSQAFEVLPGKTRDFINCRVGGRKVTVFLFSYCFEVSFCGIITSQLQKQRGE